MFVGIFRHGSDSEGDLTPAGKMQFERLAQQLEPILRGKSVIVLSSPAQRAQQSAAVLRQTLDAQLKVDERLGNERGVTKTEPVHQAIEAWSQQSGVEAIIAVTHFSAAIGVADLYSRQTGVRFSLPHMEMLGENGRGAIFDLATKTGKVL